MTRPASEPYAASSLVRASRGPTAFSDSVTFHLSAPQFVTGNLQDIEVSFGPFTLLDITGLTATFNGNPLSLDPSGNFSLGGLLAAGDYFIAIAGTTAGFFGGAYHIELTATPIPCAMLLLITAPVTAMPAPPKDELLMTRL